MKLPIDSYRCVAKEDYFRPPYVLSTVSPLGPFYLKEDVHRYIAQLLAALPKDCQLELPYDVCDTRP